MERGIVQRAERPRYIPGEKEIPLGATRLTVSVFLPKVLGQCQCVIAYAGSNAYYSSPCGHVMRRRN
jgi:hypothetical protein